MKVSKVECLPVPAGWRKNFVFVRIETDAGIVGWGALGADWRCRN
jgi:galactonate dehydratase